MNTVFLTNNLLEQANLSVTTGTINNQFPLNNLKHDHTSEFCRINGNTAKIVLDLGSISEVDIFCITGDAVENGLGFTGCELRGSATTDFSGSTAHTIILNQEYNFGFKSFTAESFRFWEITLTGDTYVDISNVFLGNKTILTNNGFSSKNFNYFFKDNSKISKNEYNQKFVDKKNKCKYIRGSINTLVTTEFDKLFDIYNNHSTTKPLWFLLDPEGNMPDTDSEWKFSGYMRFSQEFLYKMVIPGIYDISKVELEQNI